MTSGTRGQDVIDERGNLLESPSPNEVCISFIIGRYRGYRYKTEMNILENNYNLHVMKIRAFKNLIGK